METDDVLAFHHTRPFWPVHIVVRRDRATYLRATALTCTFTSVATATVL